MPFTMNRRTLLQAAALLPALSLLPPALLAEPSGGFTHSVASGDPKQDSVVLWTRYVAADGGETRLRLEIAEDERFKRIAARGVAAAGPNSDYCAHSRAGDLKPGRWYHYRFIAPDGTVSAIGRTRTLPAGRLDSFKIGVVSCANATSGWFNAYAHAAAREDLDLIVHLGDYIYESPIDRSDAIAAIAQARGIQPRGEAVSLADYRLRYASYRNDPALQELHRRFPMIAMWDDHETANNSWKDGAKNHQPEEGPWEMRKNAGIRAFREWLPMGTDDYAGYQIGDLATLFRLETRLLARTKQLDLTKALLGKGDPRAAALAFQRGALADPARTMMGSAQEQWLADGLSRSARDGTRWQVLAQQLVLAPMLLPKVTSSWYAPGVTAGGREQAELAFAAMLTDLGIPSAMDRWDGYPAARDRLFASAAQAGANLLVLSGDSHNAWASNLRYDGKAIGVELAGHSVSSLGIEKRFGGDAKAIASAFGAANPSLLWCDTSRRGYVVVELTRTAATTEWLFLPSLESRSTAVIDTMKMTTAHDSREFA